LESEAVNVQRLIDVVMALARTPRFRQFLKFSLVGFSGILVDITIFQILMSRATARSHFLLAKLCSAETALINNFAWNEVWTFRRAVRAHIRGNGRLIRFMRFHIICGAGVGLAILMLQIFHGILAFPPFTANLLAISLTTMWNFWLNALLTWRPTPELRTEK
jgi:dolichol-phosphate mannosyltransferase